MICEHVILIQDRLFIIFDNNNGLESACFENVNNFCLAPLEFRCNKVFEGRDYRKVFWEEIVPMMKWVAEDENLIGLWNLDIAYDSDVFDVVKTFHFHFSFSNVADLLMFKFKFV